MKELVREKHGADYANSNVTFPHMSAFEDIVDYDLKAFTNVSYAMINAAWCVGAQKRQTKVRFTMLDGELHIQKQNGDLI